MTDPHATGSRASITVKGFNYALDNGESLLSVKPGDELEYLNPHGGPFRVVSNDGHEVVLERIR